MIDLADNVHPPFVPGQVCCLVTLPRRLGAKAVESLYSAFAEDCNGVLLDVIKRQVDRPQVGSGTLLRELTPERVANMMAVVDGMADGKWLSPLGEGSPWPYVTVQQGGSTSAVLTYRLAGFDPEPLLPGDPHYLIAIGHVIDVVLLLNLSQRPLNESIAKLRRSTVAGLSLRACTPNWLFSVAPPEPHVEGGPGSIPEPAGPPGRFVFEAGETRLDLDRIDLDTEPAGPPSIVVAVLDTSPTPVQVAAAAAHFTENDLLADVAATVDFDPPMAHAPDAFADLRGIRASRVIDKAPTVLDHGLFVSGIVRSIAGNAARIHVVRVLSERGIGTLAHLLGTLGRLPRLLTPLSARRRLIVNLSLVAEMPAHRVLLKWLLPETVGRPDLLLGDIEDVTRLLEVMSLPLREAIDGLAGRDVLVVAAAGNVGLLAERARHAPQEPARFDNVLAVAATDRHFGSALYSNRGDMIVMGNGVAAFGGNAEPDGRLRGLGLGGEPTFDAPVGLYTAADVGADNVENRTGWAYWAGTSFATPIVTGLAARLWHRNPTLSARQILEAVRGLARPVEDADDLDVPVVRIRQRD